MQKVKGKKKIIVILGPTASGKTRLSLQLAKKYQGYVISADSRQVYKGMDIGTAKPKGRIKNYELKIKGLENNVYTIKNIPHFLINILNPNQEFTLVDWLNKTNKILTRYQLPNTNYQIPFIVGGTGLYISALVDNYQLPKQIDRSIDRSIIGTKTLSELVQELKKVDPGTYIRIDTKNKRRVIRALEYYYLNNESLFRNQKQQPSPYEFLQLGIDVPRDVLYKRIDKRVEQMIKQGLIDEVKTLLKKYPPDLPALSGIGYRQIISYLNGDRTKNEALDLLKRDSRRYAKRQMTWFKRDRRIKWIKTNKEADELVKIFLNQ